MVVRCVLAEIKLHSRSHLHHKVDGVNSLGTFSLFDCETFLIWFQVLRRRERHVDLLPFPQTKPNIAKPNPPRFHQTKSCFISGLTTPSAKDYSFLHSEIFSIIFSNNIYWYFFRSCYPSIKQRGNVSRITKKLQIT